MHQINFFSEEVEFKLQAVEPTRRWLQTAMGSTDCTIRQLTFIFTSDEQLLHINREFLKHDTYTDIITFQYSEDPKTLESDVFISIDRVKENAAQLNVPFYEELHRVMIHGVLHLIGYNDKTASQKREMRKLENHYLALRKFQTV